MDENKPNHIPKFDLAEQIMAEHRKNSSIRRKAPGHKNTAPNRQQAQHVTHMTVRPPMPPQEDKIIADIVARDIQKLCAVDS